MAEPLKKESQEKQRTPLDMVRYELGQPARQRALAAVLPKHLTPERICRLALLACEKTPKLLECNRPSLFGAILTAAQLGLEPDGVLGQAYLVPFKGRVQFIPGYKGLITLARNSGAVVSIYAGAVREKDRFEYRFGLDPKCDHVPSVEKDRGEITHFYAVATFRDGGHHFDVMTRAEVESIRDNSAAYRGGAETPWKTHFEEMGKKTAIRRIAKYLPMNVQRAAAIAGAYDRGIHAEMDEHGEVREQIAAAGTPRALAAGSFLDDFEKDSAIETTGKEVTDPQAAAEPEDQEPNREDSEQMAKLVDYATEKKVAEAELDELCRKTLGRGLVQLQPGDANTMILEIGKRRAAAK